MYSTSSTPDSLANSGINFGIGVLDDPEPLDSGTDAFIIYKL